MKNFRITQDDINKYAANGGDLNYLNQKQKAAISNEIRELRWAKGWDFYYKDSSDDILEAPQEIIDKWTANEKRFNKCRSCNYETPKYQMIEISQDIYQRAVNGWSLKDLSEKRKVKIPEEIIYQYVENGGSLNDFSSEHVATMSQMIINQYAANLDNIILYINASCKQRDKIPKCLRSVDENMKRMIILYGAARITKDDLPIEVFANYNTRLNLLRIIKEKTIKKFNEICVKYGYIDDVPVELIKIFDEKCREIQEEVYIKKQVALQQLDGYERISNNQSNLQQLDEFKSLNDKKEVIEEIKSMGW